MAARGENRFGAKRIGSGTSAGLEVKPNDALGSMGPGFEAVHGGCPSWFHGGCPSLCEPRQIDLTDFPEFESIGSKWERLLTLDLDNLCRWHDKYQAYLEEFYNLNNPVDSNASIALQCVKMEEKLQLLWRDTDSDEIILTSSKIHQHMLNLVKEGGEPRSPFFKVAATCIAKVAELMNSWLSKGYCTSIDEYQLSRDVRFWAFQALMFEGDWCVDISAPLVGIRKEAEWMLENNSLGVPDTSMNIIKFALYLVGSKSFEFVLWGIPKQLAEEGEMDSNDNDEMEVNGPLQNNTEKLIFSELNHSAEGSREIASDRIRLGPELA